MGDPLSPVMLAAIGLKCFFPSLMQFVHPPQKHLRQFIKRHGYLSADEPGRQGVPLTLAQLVHVGLIERTGFSRER